MWLISASLIVFIALRWYPYFFTAVTMGYDAGLYLYLFKQYGLHSIFSYHTLSGWLINQFPIGFAVIGRLLTPFITPERLLIPLIVTCSVLLFVSVYVLTRGLWGKREAGWAVFVLSVSAIQYHTYWYYYAKQIFASSLLLFVIYFFLRSSLWAVPLGMYIAYTHEPTFIVLMCALVTGFIIEKTKRRYYLTTAVSTLIGAAAYYLPNFTATVQQYIAPVISSLTPGVAGGTLGTSSGTFYDLPTALLLSLPYLPFALVGILKLWRAKHNAPLLGALAGSLLIILFGLFLSRRFIIFADLFLILYAGYGIAHVRITKPLLALYALLLVAFIGIYVYKTGKPEIFDDELGEIMMLRQTEPEAYVLVTDEKYMPYVYGWSERKTIAPGYGEYDVFWTIPQWHEFWESNDREKETQLLLQLPKPLYIFRGDRSAMVLTDFSGPCFTRVNWRTYQFTCDK